MAFAENMEYLKQNFPEAWQKISEIEENLKKNPARIKLLLVECDTDRWHCLHFSQG
mgnify:CR=1 FL=1